MERLSRFRAEFNVPLTKVVMGLRSAVVTAGGKQVLVGQRLKRQPRIITKLARYPAMELTRMQDIAGCRAIVDDVGVVARVQGRIERQASRIVRVFDYNSDPKPSGYRALHIVVERDGALIEIQLRTPWQQSWADLVENLDSVYGMTLKDEQGPAEVTEYLRVLAAGYHERNDLGFIGKRRVREIVAARDTALGWLGRLQSLR